MCGVVGTCVLVAAPRPLYYLKDLLEIQGVAQEKKDAAKCTELASPGFVTDRRHFSLLSTSAFSAAKPTYLTGCCEDQMAEIDMKGFKSTICM